MLTDLRKRKNRDQNGNTTCIPVNDAGEYESKRTSKITPGARKKFNDILKMVECSVSDDSDIHNDSICE